MNTHVQQTIGSADVRRRHIGGWIFVLTTTFAAIAARAQVTITFSEFGYPGDCVCQHLVYGSFTADGGALWRDSGTPPNYSYYTSSDICGACGPSIHLAVPPGSTNVSIKASGNGWDAPNGYKINKVGVRVSVPSDGFIVDVPYSEDWWTLPIGRASSGDIYLDLPVYPYPTNWGISIDEITYTPPPPKVKLAVQKDAAGTYAARIDYTFFAPSCSSRTLSLDLLPTSGESGSTYFSQTSLPATGTITQSLGSFDTNRTIQARALDCYGSSTSDATTVACRVCKGGPPTSVGSPVRLYDGVMTYSETDPLPTTIGSEFQREYATNVSLDGKFGIGWSSLFDAGMLTTGGTPARVTVINEDRSHVTFVASGDGWVQAWPFEGTAGTLTGSDATGYTFRDAGGGIVRTFDTLHDLTRLQDLRRGRAVTITYDTSGNPATIADEAGAWAVTITTANNHVTQIAVDGRPDLTWSYAYTGSLLTSVSLAGASAAWRTYEYANNRLASVIDATGNVIERHDYDVSGRATSSYAASGGDITNITYGATDANGVATATVTRADNSQATYDQAFAGGSVITQHVDSGCTSCGINNATAVYDDYGNINRLQNGRGYITSSTYDATGRQLTQTMTALVPSGCDPSTDPNYCRLTAAGLATATLVRSTATQTTTYAYADQNWPGKPTHITRDSVEVGGNTVTETFTYDATTGETLVHSITGAIDTTGTQETHTTTTTLYAAGDVAAFAPGGAFQNAWLSLPQPTGVHKSVDGPRTDINDVTTFVYYPYDASVPGAWRGKIAATKNPLGQITRYEDYDVWGRATTTVDPNGVTTRATYDALGRLLASTVAGSPGCDTTTDPLCASDLTKTRTYASTTGPLLSEQSPAGNVTAYTYDLRGRVLTITRGSKERITYAYDPATGKKSSETYASYQNDAWITTETETYTYTSDGNPSTVVHADNTSVRYGYLPDGTLANIQDENHTSPNTNYAYDPANHLATVTQTLATAPGGQITTRYAYDVAGNLTSVTDPNNNTTTYTYDDFGRLQKQTSPVSGTSTYTYDYGGNVLTTTDAASATTTRGYDALNRITSATSTRSGATMETVTWTYDDLASGGYGIGQPASMTDPTGTTTYKYEHRGFLRTEVKTINGSTYTTTYTYDSDGNRDTVTYPSGLVAHYTFDYADRPYTLTANGTSIVIAAMYAPFGPLSSVTFGNGTTRSMQYDQRYRPQENKLTGPSGTIADYTYAADNVGNITQVHDLTNPAYNRDFGYDDLNRLTTATTGASLWGAGSYTYDSMGNVLTATLGSWKSMTSTLVGTTPKLSSVVENGASRSIAYDTAGNETSVGTTTFTYSARNQLIAAGASTYMYDGRGLLTVSTAPLVTVTTPITISGGTTGTGTVALPAAQAVNTVVALSSDNQAASVPASITISAGQTTSTFTITTSRVASDLSVTITAAANGGTNTATVTVLAARVSAITVNPTMTRAGDPVTATVTIDSPAVATMSVAITGTIVGYQVTASVPIGATTGTASITPMALRWAQDTGYRISATLNGATVTTTLLVTPPILATFGITPTTTYTGGTNGTAQATVTGTPDFAPLNGMTVSVTSTNPSIAGAYGAGIPLPGSTVSGSTPFLTAPVSTTSSVTMTAATGTVTQPVAVTVQPAPVTIASLTLSPTSVVGSNPVTGTITLTAAAPTGGIDIDWQAVDNSARPRPAFLHIPAGTTSASFTIDTTVVTSTGVTATITATHAATTKSATLQLSAPKANYVSGLTAQNGTSVPNGIAVTGGTSVSATATVGSAAQGKTTIPLTSSNSAVLTVPASVNVPSGASAVNFTITTLSVTSPASVTVTASYGGVLQTLIVTVLPANSVTITSFSGLTSGPMTKGPSTSNGTVTLSGPAPAGGATVTLSGNRAGIIDIPASMTIPAGATSGSFSYTLYAFLGYPRTTDIAATWQGITQASRFTVNAVTLTAENSGEGKPVQCAALVVEPCLTAAGLRPVIAAVGDPSRYYLYTPELQLLTETESSTSNMKPIAYSYLSFGGQPVAQIDSSNSVRWYATDHLGTPFLQTDATGAVVWRVEATPYGEIFAYRIGAALHQPLRFPGQTAIDATESIYNMYRWYRTASSRYTQPDPIALAGGLNLYNYVADNPLGFDDPNGLSFVDVRDLAERTYNTLADYQKTNPCGAHGTSYSCTERLLEDIGCPCSCKGTGWGMDVSAIVHLRYHLAGGPPNSNLPPAFYWNGYRRHEDLHLEDLRRELKKYADGLEQQRFTTETDCNIACGQTIGGFRQWLNNWAVGSNRRLH